MDTRATPAQDGNARRRPRILLCDDDSELLQLLAEYLSRHELDIICAESAEMAIQILNEDPRTPDVLVLDLMLPGMDGLSALKHIRQTRNLPILMMSARGEPIDRVVGLECGADDYLSKPCFPRELLARLHVMLRRSPENPASDAAPAEVSLGTLRLQFATRHASLADCSLRLTGAEFAVLWTLALECGKFVSRETLTTVALHRPLERFDRAIDVHVSRLRKKLQHAANDAPTIDSARGAGYILIAPPETGAPVST
jgi:two-component system, OmpR family, response regulator CpxR